jgi:hypothetical protein
MKPTKTLPGNYHAVGTFDLRNNTTALLQLNLLGFVLFAVSAGLFTVALLWLRPVDTRQGLVLGISGIGGMVQAWGVVIVVTAVMIVLHEAVHGMFFWLFTGTAPKFAFKGVYAYAAAPDWYMPKFQYLVTALAPLVLLSALGVGLMAVVPAGGFVTLLLFLVTNASGAIGDLWVAVWLLRQPDHCYGNDQGDAVTLYVEEEKSMELKD